MSAHGDNRGPHNENHKEGTNDDIAHREPSQDASKAKIGEIQHCPQKSPLLIAPYPNTALTVKKLGRISSPYMLSRFLTIDLQNEPLRHEASLAMKELRITQGDNMLATWIEDVEKDLDKEEDNDQDSVRVEAESENKAER